MSSATNVFLTGGALAKNVFWQVAGSVEIGTTAHVEGVILTQTSVALRTGASIKGRLLAQTAVSIDSSVVVAP
jgi:cytoskeletal protein CcmA (bactofilin family)